MASPPRIIAGRYRVIEEAGRGGMGTVWRCVDERLGREVAVKQVGRLPGESVTDQARALREARSSAALNHPNVVSVYDAHAEDDHVWLVMEYVPGRTLAQILREEGALPPARVAWIGAQVADGLAAAHARGTVHRDVKPGNILVTDDDRARISDFGIARTAGDDTLTHSGMVTGTPNYLAPEVARGGDPRPASDVWALGATLFAAVEGRAPYDSNPNALAVLAMIASEEPPAPEQAGPLTEPITRMLDRDPDSRWSIGEVAHALHTVHDRRAVPTGTHEETPAPEEAVREEPVAAPVVLATAPADYPGDGKSRSRARGPLLVGGLVALLVVAIAVLALLSDGGESPAVDEEPSGSPPAAEESPAGPSESPEPSTAEESPVETPTSSTVDEPETTGPIWTAPAGGGSRTAFVEDYYAYLPDDPESGWARLAPSYQAQTSYQSYAGFWSTIDEVTIQDTAPAGDGAVDATLLYNGAEEEVRRIYLERSEEGWLITDDEIVG